MRKIPLLLTTCVALAGTAAAQIDAGLLRYPDVSATQIVFTYANDIWVVPKTGGTATKLSSPAGVESWPKFSPDGKSIAFTGNYDGNKDAYVIPTGGGIPVRLTEHGYPDRVVDWTPDGKRVLFASGRESGRDRFNQFYTVAATGGPAEKLPFPYAEFGCYSPDGSQIAMTFVSQAGRNWKRYRGGWKADIHIFNFAKQTDENITGANEPGEEFPMWSGNYIYFTSDRGPEVRMNLWRYNVNTKALEQLTNFKDYDVHTASLGPEDIVFENGGKLYLYNLSGGTTKEVNIEVVTDRTALKPRVEGAANYIQHTSISPDGNRVLIEARGDIFSLPATKGYVEDLTRTSGSAERNPVWSPDGKTIAFWGDESGEYQLYLYQPGKDAAPKKVTSYGAGFRYNLYWSPDSKKLVFIDQAMRIKIYDVAANETIDVDKALHFAQGSLEGFTVSWSPNSRWLTYARDLENLHNAVFLFDTKGKKLTQVTSDFYDFASPTFDPDAKYLYVITGQSFQPYYSDIDNSFIYANSRKVGVITLKKSTESVLFPKNDTVAIKEDQTAPKDDKVKDKKKDSAATAKKAITGDDEIDFDGLETRLVLLPLANGNYGNIAASAGKIIYQKFDNTGAAGSGSTSLKYWDIDKQEEKTIIDGIDGYILSANGEKILVQKGQTFAVIANQEGQKIDKTVPTGDMQMTVDPVQEWKQIYVDAWRIERDFFYDANMHGVDWNKIKERYAKMLEGASNREDVNFILGEMLGELNSSHTYHGGGDEEEEPSKNVGYLGVDWVADGGYYKIKKIVRGAIWDAGARSALDAPGVDIKEGSYILAVNGNPLTTDQEPFAAFQGLADKTVELTYNSTPSFTGAKKALVQTMGSEYDLRYLAWVESNRKRVAEATNGDVGYIYVPSTGVDGQTELIRQFNAQWDKKALVIDERFNSGGQIPDRFIEMLNRTPLAFWATRDGSSPWPWPQFANFGPKVMLINGWSGSGGDAFPDFFRKKGLGPLIGKRTWGGLIGISGTPQLIDGGGITAPSFRMFNPDGTWFKEGHGVDPDIVVDEDLASMAKGVDPQLERAITEIKSLLKTKPFNAPAVPPVEKRN